MWELDYKESWAPKNWCFWTVVLEKTFEGPLDCKEIQPVHPKGNQSCVFFGKVKVKVKSLSHVWLLATPWTAAYQAPPSMGFSRQEYWSGVPLPSPVSYITTLYLSKWRNWHWHIITTSLTLDFICFSPLFPMNVLFLFQNSFQGTHCN